MSWSSAVLVRLALSVVFKVPADDVGGCSSYSCIVVC